MKNNRPDPQYGDWEAHSYCYMFYILLSVFTLVSAAGGAAGPLAHPLAEVVNMPTMTAALAPDQQAAHHRVAHRTT